MTDLGHATSTSPIYFRNANLESVTASCDSRSVSQHSPRVAHLDIQIIVGPDRLPITSEMQKHVEVPVSDGVVSRRGTNDAHALQALAQMLALLLPQPPGLLKRKLHAIQLCDQLLCFFVQLWQGGVELLVVKLISHHISR